MRRPRGGGGLRPPPPFVGSYSAGVAEAAAEVAAGAAAGAADGATAGVGAEWIGGLEKLFFQPKVSLEGGLRVAKTADFDNLLSFSVASMCPAGRSMSF